MPQGRVIFWGWIIMVVSTVAFTLLLVGDRSRWLVAASFLALLAGAMMASHTDKPRGEH